MDGKVRGFFVLVTDVTPRKLLEKELLVAKEKAEALATHDFLTGLPNRVLLEDRVSRAIALARRNQSRLAMLFLDLNGFKRVNDTFGHGCGDTLLVDVARRLEGSLRESDTVARLGGDEFVVLLPELRIVEHAEAAAKKVIDAMASTPFDGGGHKLDVTFSIGIAVFPEHGQDMRELLANADHALGVAKRSGKNRWTLSSPAAGISGE